MATDNTDKRFDTNNDDTNNDDTNNDDTNNDDNIEFDDKNLDQSIWSNEVRLKIKSRMSKKTICPCCQRFVDHMITDCPMLQEYTQGQAFEQDIELGPELESELGQVYKKRCPSSGCPGYCDIYQVKCRICRIIDRYCDYTTILKFVDEINETEK